ncbi:hypothetical protein CAOG_05082 [Capsaspora owczarzaki ATCC 30864]|uniref:Replication protein A C-terminal domain-containing protein n=1 Tax=Capsaspora owczarzaki (strain ATCC 30864) TaxID=595528 RepID=A0A0D2WRD0_CAPO3|nr:hypothetical protein CAOG_05082 [Capsaspora owczarzaki ATCC 30864]KJE94440.1 hypothetical protein CAOG_005082 [Capsaspora owczarzaki ATCC 30864]|eukprot:XP_004346767.1 hypothetical protein CAOG_05082 [Capsaspora owczarzaki ATCC 30864]
MAYNTSPGAGYMQQQAGSPHGDGQDKGNARAKGITSCTIRQILQMAPSQGNNWRMDGAEFAVVKIVGVIRSVQEVTSHRTYLIEDGTSQITAKAFGPVNNADLREGVYARITGPVREFQNVRSIHPATLHPITNFDEITHHSLEAILTHLQRTKGSLQDRAGGAGQPASSLLRSHAQTGDLSSLATQLVTLIGSSPDISFDDIRDQFPNATPDQLRNVLTDLTNEGHVYTTHDDDHFKLTSG